MGRQAVGIFRQEGQHGAQVLEVEQQQALFVGDLEGDVEHAFLHVIEIHQPRQQQRPHFGNSGADRMALLAEHVPEHGREAVGLIIQSQRFGAGDQRIIGLARRGDTGQIAFDIGGEDRNAGAGKAFCHHLQGDRLAGAGGARHQAMAIGQAQQQHVVDLAFADENVLNFCHGVRSHLSPGTSLRPSLRLVHGGKDAASYWLPG